MENNEMLPEILLKESLDNCNKAIDDYKSKMAELTGEVTKHFSRTIVALMQTGNNIESIRWVQYTPYFNDGETCYFGVYADELDINDKDYYDIFDNLSYSDQTIINNITNIIESTPEEIMQSMYGDHVKITIKRNGDVIIDDYDHD
jgi:hypothetical protein